MQRWLDEQGLFYRAPRAKVEAQQKPIYPPLEVWPAWSNWCGLAPSGYWVFFEREPVTTNTSREASTGQWGNSLPGEYLPNWREMLYQRPMEEAPALPNKEIARVFGVPVPKGYGGKAL